MVTTGLEAGVGVGVPGALPPQEVAVNRRNKATQLTEAGQRYFKDSFCIYSNIICPTG
jgi:hypothetical protein